MEPDDRESASRPELTVGAVVVHDERLLLIRRGRSPAAGRWSVPGGRVESGETMAAAVEREVREETGLAVTCGGLAGWVERIEPEHHYVILDFWAEVVDPRRVPTAGDDAAEVAWVPLGEVAELDLVDGLLTFLTEHGVLDRPRPGSG